MKILKDYNDLEYYFASSPSALFKTLPIKVVGSSLRKSQIL